MLSEKAKSSLARHAFNSLRNHYLLKLINCPISSLEWLRFIFSEFAEKPFHFSLKFILRCVCFLTYLLPTLFFGTGRARCGSRSLTCSQLLLTLCPSFEAVFLGLWSDSGCLLVTLFLRSHVACTRYFAKTPHCSMTCVQVFSCAWQLISCGCSYFSWRTWPWNRLWRASRCRLETYGASALLSHLHSFLSM